MPRLLCAAFALVWYCWLWDNAVFKLFTSPAATGSCEGSVNARPLDSWFCVTETFV